MPDTDKPAPQFGEPWMCGDEDCYGCCEVRDSRGRCVISNHERDTNQTTSEQMERICDTMNAMANIPDPQAFVCEVRELLERCSDIIGRRTISQINNSQYQCLDCGKIGGAVTIDHYESCVHRITRNDLSAMLARLDAGRGSE